MRVVVDESHDVAERLGQPLSTSHLLLCLFTVKNRAQAFLSDHTVTADRLLERLPAAADESPLSWDRVFERAESVANAVAAGGKNSRDTITSLHVVVALTSFVDCAAYRLMAMLDVDMATVRNTALAWLRSTTRAPLDDRSGTPVPTPLIGGPGPAGANPIDAVSAGRRDKLDTRILRRWETFAGGEAKPPGQKSVRRGAGDTLRSLAGRVRNLRPQSADHPAAPPCPDARPAAKRVSRGRIPSSSTPLPPSVTRRTQQTEAVKDSDVAPTKPARRRRLNRQAFELTARENPVLSRYGRNLTIEAIDGRIDDAIGRSAETQRLVDILNKRRSNNPLLLGDPGVGKTAIVEGLARYLVQSELDGIPTGLEGRIVVELEASQLLAGTSMRGSFAERMSELKGEVAKAGGRIIVFMDELHHWIGAGAGGDGSGDGAGDLKTALARGEFPCIGATTFDEYRKYIESDAAFARRFQVIRVDEPTVEEATEILRGVAPSYERHHGIEIQNDAVEAAVRLSHRYLPERRLPDKAISVLDLAGSRARRIEARAVNLSLVAQVVAEAAGIEPDKLLMSEAERFLNLETRLMSSIIGHRHVVERVSQVLRRNYAGFISGRPIGSFLFLGPTGVGKTEFARVLASLLFENEDSMLRIDMSEYMEAHSVARLIGAPPGYVGYDAPGQLTEPVRRRPYQLVLFDELEKAHPDVLNLLIQILDDGRITDARGRTVDFSNTVILMTSNLGADTAFQDDSRRVGFTSSGGNSSKAGMERALSAARAALRPELWNRIDEPLAFAPLSRDEIARIAHLQIARSSSRLMTDRHISYSASAEVIDFLVDNGGFDPELGARPMRRTIERYLEHPIAESILRGEYTAPADLEVQLVDGRITVVVLGDDDADDDATEIGENGDSATPSVNAAG